MKRRINHIFIRSLPLTSVLVIGIFCSNASLAFAQEPENDDAACTGRAKYDLMRLMDPATGSIPENIRTRELRFASLLSTSTDAFKGREATSQNVDWLSRGPSNIGGRTRALGIDVANENIILAGGTSGGMWRSTDRGSSWMRTTALTVLPSARSLAQDPRAGKTNIWYYGTGEMGGNTAAYPLLSSYGIARSWGDYYGNGIFKSSDDGNTWNILRSTTSDSFGSLVQPFNFVNKIVVDPSYLTQDVLYAAVAGGIERSSDGGASWSMVLGDFPKGSAFTDVAVTSKGIVYAIFGSVASLTGLAESSNKGIYRSADGLHWVRITPSGWQGATRYTSLAIAPSNENVVYLASEDVQSALEILWKYTYLSGDGSGNGGVFEDRSTNLSVSGVSIVVYVKVKPDDENTVFVGGVVLVRSTDGFATSDRTAGVNPPHIDQVSMSFFPSNSASMIVGCDGGLFKTDNNLASLVQWTNLNNGYVTSQFYTVAIDHATPGDITLIGGLQDNGIKFTNSGDSKQPWVNIDGADGATCAIADGRTSYFESAQNGLTWRKVLNNHGEEMSRTRIDPIGSTPYLFINPYCLDPTNTNRMYFDGGTFLWRNDDVTLIPLGGTTTTSLGWTKLTQTTVLQIDSNFTPFVTALTATRTPKGRVYYGTNDGRLFRVDSANTGDPTPKAIWEGKGFPKLAFVSSIAADSKNADNVIVAFANYNVQSLFYSSDGGTSWTPIGGNLEEHPDGSGSGPSFRTAAIMHSGNGMIYLVGTSTGLYSTSTLNGMSTAWTLEGPTAIGNNIVNMIDTRESDGMVAVATCGHGVFSGNFAPAASVSAPLPSHQIQFSPNPTTGLVTVHGSLSSASHVIVSNILGELMIEQSVSRSADFTLDLSSFPVGTYYVRITSSRSSATGVIVRR